MSESFALILAGGGGTRLWPISRRQMPKQLLTLGGPETLLAATFRRAAALVGADRTLVVTAADQAEGIAHALPSLPRDNIVVEPAARNTAAAVGLGAAVIARRAGRDATFAVLPSDAFIADETGFVSAAKTALAHAATHIVTMGIRPSHPETGYGYLQPGPEHAPGVRQVVAFVEKPDAAQAQRYLADGYLWNAGMFFMSAQRLFQEARQQMPSLADVLEALVTNPDPGETAQRLYPGCKSVSIDYGIMEHARGILVVPADIGWNDVGSWDALPAVRAPDGHGNVSIGDTVVLAAKGNVIVSDQGAPLVAVTDVEDLVIVATRDAVLVTRRDRAQNVRSVVEALTRRGRGDLT